MNNAMACWKSWVMVVFLMALAGCGGDSTSQVSIVCPDWNQGDWWSVNHVKTVSGVATESTSTYVVTQRTATSVTVGDGTTVKTYDIADGKFVPTYEEKAPEPAASFYGSETTYSSATAFCPPPAAGQSYEALTWIMGPFEGTGDYLTTTVTVTAVGPRTITIPLGQFTASNVALTKKSYWENQVLAEQSEISRDYVSGLGVVRDVENISASSTTITDTLTAYDFDGPALGTLDNPIVVAATPETMSLVSYRGKVAAGPLYFKMTGLFTDNAYAISLTGLSDNADLYVYPDAFTTLGCSSTNTATTDESCNTNTSPAGELFIKIDGSQTTDGAYFVLEANT